MSLKDLLRFESKASREKRRRRYAARLYPFGERQQEAERKALAGLFPEEKAMDELVFLLITLREGLLNAQLDQDEDDYIPRDFAIESWEKKPGAVRLTGRGKLILLTLADMENAAGSCDELPSAADVLKVISKENEGHSLGG